MPLAARIQKAATLVEALPYIKKFRGKYLVVKLGGSVMYSEELKTSLAQDIVLLKYVGIHPIVVHGGGKEISKWLERLGKEPKFVNGLRVTDAETMEITEMVLFGKANRELVALLNQNGGRAVGLSGKDGNLFIAKRRGPEDGVDLGFVGEITSVDPTSIRTLCAEGVIPVISSIAVTNEGETLNINADEAAAQVASGVEAQKLFFLSDVDGILRNGELLKLIDYHQAEALLGDPSIQGGMLPKLEHSLKAMKRGVEHVHIVNGTNQHAVLLEVFTDSGVGTMIYKRKR